MESGSLDGLGRENNSTLPQKMGLRAGREPFNPEFGDLEELAKSHTGQSAARAVDEKAGSDEQYAGAEQIAAPTLRLGLGPFELKLPGHHLLPHLFALRIELVLAEASAPRGLIGRFFVLEADFIELGRVFRSPLFLGSPISKRQKRSDYQQHATNQHGNWQRERPLNGRLNGQFLRRFLFTRLCMSH